MGLLSRVRLLEEMVENRYSTRPKRPQVLCSQAARSIHSGRSAPCRWPERRTSGGLQTAPVLSGTPSCGHPVRSIVETLERPSDDPGGLLEQGRLEKCSNPVVQNPYQQPFED